MSNKTPRLTPDYFKLASRFPLIPIEDRKHFDEACNMLDELSVVDEERLTSGQAKYLLVLTDLVERYEQDVAPAPGVFDDGVAALQYLLEQSGMSASDLGRMLGNRQLGSAILRRERELSKAHIATLAEHFKVSTDLFLMPGRRRARKAS